MAKDNAQDTQATDLVLGEHNPFVNQQLTVAQVLADEKDDVLKRIGANREVLRNMATMGYLSPEQATAIREFYPDRPRKSKDENGNGKGETFAAKEVAKNATS